jgi:hypothetical protein
MRVKFTHSIIASAVLCAVAVTTAVAQTVDPLPSWNDGKSKQCAGAGTLFCLLVRHSDGEREWNYDVTPLGWLEKGLEEAKAQGWTVVDMKNDWNRSNRGSTRRGARERSNW